VKPIARKNEITCSRRLCCALKRSGALSVGIHQILIFSHVIHQIKIENSKKNVRKKRGSYRIGSLIKK